jgi:transposase, IS6 family
MQFSCGIFKSPLIYRIYLRLALSDRFARFAFGVLSFATSPPSSHPAQNAKAEVLQLCKSGRISWADMVLAPSVQRYAPEMERRLRSRLKPTNDSWRVDETYVRVKGKWVYLYRAVDSTGATIDFLLSAKRDAAAAESFQSQSVRQSNHPSYKHRQACRLPAHDCATQRRGCSGGELPTSTGAVPLVTSWNKDHRAIKRRINVSQHFRSFWGAWRTIAGYEAIHMIRKDQACWSAAGVKLGLLHRFIVGMFGIEA